MKIGIVGNGFVGNAVRNGFSPNVGCDAEVKVYDKNPSKSTDRLIDVVNDSDFVFVSVFLPVVDLVLTTFLTFSLTTFG